MSAMASWVGQTVLLVIYLAPSIMAFMDDEYPRLSTRNRVVLLVNVLLGWTGIGWLVALIVLVRWPE